MAKKKANIETELAELIQQKKEIDARINALKNQEVRNGRVKYQHRTTYAARPGTHSILIESWVKNSFPIWREVVGAETLDDAAKECDEIARALTELAVKLRGEAGEWLG